MQEGSSEENNSKNFIFTDGESIDSIDSLLDKLQTISISEFESHVNDDKNDFADWVEHVFEESILSNLMRKAKDKDVMTTIISSFLETKDQIKEFTKKEDDPKQDEEKEDSDNQKNEFSNEKDNGLSDAKEENKNTEIEESKEKDGIELLAINDQNSKPLKDDESNPDESSDDGKRPKEDSKEDDPESGTFHFEVTQEIDSDDFEETSDDMEDDEKKEENTVQENIPKDRAIDDKKENDQPKAESKKKVKRRFLEMFRKFKEIMPKNDFDIESLGYEEMSKEGKEEKESERVYTPEYVKTGIVGFDSLITNGIPKGSAVLMSGGAGSGKTTFCLQLLVNAAKEGEKCLYLTFEEEPARLRSHMINYGWDPLKLEEEGNLIIKKMDPFELSRSVEGLLAKASGELIIELDQLEGVIPEGFKPDRIIIDSLSAVGAAFVGKEEGYRIYVEQLFNLFKESGATSFLISEIEENTSKYTKSGVEEFLADAVIIFYNLRQKSVRVNAIEVVKLRGTSHQKKIVPFKMVSGEGIKVFPKEDPFID